MDHGSPRALRNSRFAACGRFCTAGARLRINRPAALLGACIANLKPVLFAQFWISIPVFILSEANLGILGLGVAEPMPSWGSLLKELEGLVSVGEEPWKFVPLVLLVIVVTSFQFLLSRQEEVAA